MCLRRSLLVSRVGIVGLGWSGSGAVVEYYSKIRGYGLFPREFDFYRSPDGLIQVSSKGQFNKWVLKEVVASVRWCLVSLFKSSAATRIKIIVAELAHLFAMLCAVISLCVCSVRRAKVIYLGILETLLGSKNVLLLDQPLFIEQLYGQNLSADICECYVVVIRRPEDQLFEITSAFHYLRPKTIRESFFFGAQEVCKVEFDDLLFFAIVKTLIKRYTLLLDLPEEIKRKTKIVLFEDLVMEADAEVAALDDFFRSFGVKTGDLAAGRAPDEFFCQSRRNVGVGAELVGSLSSERSCLFKEVDEMYNRVVQESLV